MRWWPWRKPRAANDALDEPLQALFGDSSVGVLFVDQSRQIVSANEAALALIDEQARGAPFGVRCGDALACPLGTACPLDEHGHPETSKSCEAPVFGRMLHGPNDAQQVMISCHRLPFSPRTKVRGMVVIRRRAA